MQGMDLRPIPMDMVINIINIFVLFIIFRKLLYKPVKQYMDKRSQKIQAELDNAQKQSEEAALSKQKLDAELKAAMGSKAKLMLEGEAAANKNAEEIIANAKLQAQQLLQDARETIAREQNQAIKAAKNDIVEIAVSIAEKLLQREVSLADNQKTVDEFFKRLG